MLWLRVASEPAVPDGTQLNVHPIGGPTGWGPLMVGQTRMIPGEPGIILVGCRHSPWAYVAGCVVVTKPGSGSGLRLSDRGSD